VNQLATPQQHGTGRATSRSDEIIDLIDRCLADLESRPTARAGHSDPASADGSYGRYA
jgi:hypothetical protein